MVKTLVITSCTGEKKYNPGNKLVQGDFADKNILTSKENELSEFRLPAAEMYTGAQHLRLMEGINSIRNRYGKEVIDLYIVSAGYGLISEHKKIVPYEVTFNKMSGEEIDKWSDSLCIHSDLNKLLQSYDLVFFLLGDQYLRALKLPVKSMGKDKKYIFFASPSSKDMIPPFKPYYFYDVRQDDAKSFSYGLVGLKGYLFKLLSGDIVNSGLELFQDIYTNPRILSSLLNKYRKNDQCSKQLEFDSVKYELDREVALDEHERVDIKSVSPYVITKDQYAKNYHTHEMKYFIPECDDRVDPNYDFIRDLLSENRNAYLHDVYAHEIYDTPNYDGLLVSKVNIENSKTKKAQIEKVGIHKYLRYPEDKPIMGDCGAFGYIMHNVPPYQTEEIVDYYESLGFNIGVSIDHLIVGKIAQDEMERERRYKITQENAEKFIEIWKNGKYNFIPSGVAQGWDPQSYKESVAALIDMGYSHISIGGLAKSQTKDIIPILEAIAPILPDYLEVHLFGVARIDAVDIFRKLGVTSFDSASHLRRAWLSERTNYFTFPKGSYAALRVPQTHSNKIKNLIEDGKGTLEEYSKLEQDSIENLRKFDRDEIDLKSALESTLRYESFIREMEEKKKNENNIKGWIEKLNKENHLNDPSTQQIKYDEMTESDFDVEVIEDRIKSVEAIVNDYKTWKVGLYRRVLEDRPWTRCGCTICNQIGIETIIFRGNNRNRRRGFHNTHVFYKQLKEILK